MLRVLQNLLRKCIAKTKKMLCTIVMMTKLYDYLYTLRFKKIDLVNSTKWIELSFYKSYMQYFEEKTRLKARNFLLVKHKCFLIKS